MWRPTNHQRSSRSFLFLVSLLTILSHFQIPIATAIPTPNAQPQPQLPSGGAQIQEDTGQVNINGDPSGIENSPTVPNLPITATIFSGVPGPKSCRGHIMFDLLIPSPPPNTTDSVTDIPEANENNSRIPKCYNLPTPAGCGNFVANKQDGCEIRLFAEPYCRLYMNTAVFVPEQRSVGGNWRSVEVRCGVEAPDPETLGRPPLQDLMNQKGMGMGH